jgi:hypothetical protein
MKSLPLDISYDGMQARLGFMTLKESKDVEGIRLMVRMGSYASTQYIAYVPGKRHEGSIADTFENAFSGFLRDNPDCADAIKEWFDTRPKNIVLVILALTPHLRRKMRQRGEFNIGPPRPYRRRIEWATP